MPGSSSYLFHFRIDKKGCSNFIVISIFLETSIIWAATVIFQSDEANGNCHTLVRWTQTLTDYRIWMKNNLVFTINVLFKIQMDRLNNDLLSKLGFYLLAYFLLVIQSIDIVHYFATRLVYMANRFIVSSLPHNVLAGFVCGGPVTNVPCDRDRRQRSGFVNTLGRIHETTPSNPHPPQLQVDMILCHVFTYSSKT